MQYKIRFRLITANVQEQIMNCSTQRLRLFITGNAGTGTTVYIFGEPGESCYGKHVTKESTLTGVAARLIRCFTLHSAKLPVLKDGRILQTPLLTEIY